MNTISVEAVEVSHLLLSPQTDHLARIVPGVPVTESKLPGHVAIPILEDQDGGLVDLDCDVPISTCGMVHVGFLSSTDTSVNVLYKSSVGESGRKPYHTTYSTLQLVGVR